MNTATASFNTTVRQMTQMSPQTNDRNVSVKKKNKKQASTTDNTRSVLNHAYNCALHREGIF